jgi:hypothetical protein
MAERFRRPQQPNDTSNGASSENPFPALLRTIGRFFREHPAIAGSLLYLQVTTVGVVYSWNLFRHFDINIFDYAEANDFLLAAFKDPIVFMLSTFTIFLIFLPTAMIYLWRMFNPATMSETPAEEKSAEVLTGWVRFLYAGWVRSLYAVFILAFIVGYTLVPPLLISNGAADRLQSSSYEPLTTVQYRATSGSDEQTTEKGLRVIGTTQNFVFFYDKNENRTLIIPNAQIVEMKQSVTKD